MALRKLTELGRPPRKGSSYLVPCLTYRRDLKEWEDWENTDNLVCIPVYPQLHTDFESGQDYPHFHVDYRFVKNHDFYFDEYIPEKKYYQKVYAPARINIRDGKQLTIKLMRMRCVSTQHRAITSPELIKNTKLSHDCIWKGKCPHRGYDLSNECPVNGVITCPLHGLQFDAVTGKVLNHEKVSK